MTGNLNGTINVTTTGGNTTYPCSGTGMPGPLITTSTSGNGTITPSTNVNYGGSITITMTPFSGYTLDTLTDNGNNVTASQGSSGTYTYILNNVTVNHTLIASFKYIYTITASVTGTGGSISPTSVTTYYGGSQTFTLTPQSGYILDKLIDNGVDVTSSTTINYSNKTYGYRVNFNNITQDHSIQASYKIGTFPPPPANAVPAISMPVYISMVAGLGGYMFWLGRRRRKDITSDNA